MPKKELPTTIRQMHGFGPKMSAAAEAAILSDVAKLTSPSPKDAIIAELRASLAQLEAADKARRAKQRDRTAKVRAKK